MAKITGAVNSADDFTIDIEICPIAILLVSSAGKILRTNRRLDRLFGYEAKELHGQSVEVLVPPQVRPYHSDLRNAFFEVPTSRQMGTGRDLHGVGKDGSMIPVEVGLDPVQVDNDIMVIVTVLDIRERKKNEAMILRAVNAAASAMIQVDESGAIELVNNKACQLFGYEHDEMIGSPIEILVPNRFRRKHVVYRDSYNKDRYARNMGEGRDLFGLRKDGTEFPIEIGLTPVDEMEGKSTMATIIDVTDRKARENDIAQKALQLERLNEELRQFAYSASHDLKAPLASIAGLMHICETDLELGDVEELKANVYKAKSLAERLAARIEVVLSLAKSELVSSDWEEIDVQERFETIWNAVKDDRVHIDTDFQHEGPVHSVPVRFDLILENLLSNAVKYYDPSQTTRVIRIKTWTAEDHFCLSVADNGIGIPAEFHDCVFKLFQRFSDNDKTGSGIGLALAKKYTTQLGGEIKFESTQGNTVFTVALPQNHRHAD
ncbi:sensor histidine kinase [Blastopirellula retiformator]|uniref:histidine kinase n=1 Tax=Blastopirellula retiformator TaxID=2527970 RepID=A0A5C5V4Q3_9BACT|nr:PAS domain S-box protein [Blastopirellula retiformator]TWT32747.1 Sensor protein FixL [Blastopirellula retiformator]